MRLAAALILAALMVQSSPAPSPTSSAPVYFGKPAARFTLSSRPLGFDPDGNARWLVVARFSDAQGRPTRIMANSDLGWISRDGYVQWQTRLRFGQPAAILKTQREGPIAMTVRCNFPRLGSSAISTDTRLWSAPRVVAQPLGPHLVQIGWFPREQRLVRIVRLQRNAAARTLAVIAGPSSTFRDVTVQPARQYQYVIYRADEPPVSLRAQTPVSPPPTGIASASGKAMWLYFTANPFDAAYYQHLNPKAIVDRAVRAGLHYVELRTAYGAYWEITPEAKPTIDAIIDGLASHGIGTIGWSVPRDATFEDLAASIRTAYYRTARGTRFTGLAVDLERGDEFMGGAPQGLDALWQYTQLLRQTLGSRYLIVATVEDPFLEHLTPGMYPYDRIARYSDVLQPMVYWRTLRADPADPARVRAVLDASYRTVAALAKRRIAISIGGQTSALGPGGAPPAPEITASLEASRSAGAVGECFFAWDGTQPSQWSALAAYHW